MGSHSHRAGRGPALAAVLVLALSMPAIGAAREVPTWDSSERWLDVAGVWKLAAGDDPLWAAPGFGDDDWQDIEIPTGSGLRKARGEIAWYRLEVRIDPPGGLSEEQRQRLRLGVAIGKVDSAYEIFAGPKHTQHIFIC